MMLHLKHGLVLLQLGLKRIFSTKLTGRLFFTDYFIQVILLLFIAYTSSSSGYLDSRNLAWRYWPWYVVQWGLVWATWTYGYNAINEDTRNRHYRFTILRLGFCLVSVPCFAYDRIIVQHRQTSMNTFFLVLIVLSAISHLGGVNQRLSQYHREREVGMINTSDKAVNLMTNSKMEYLSAYDREVLREKSTKFMTSNIGVGNRFWYHPFVRVANCKNLTAVGPTPASPVSFRSDLEEIRKVTKWDHQRMLLLNQQPQSLPSGLSVTGLNLQFKPHVLCEKCSWMCSTSYLIRLQRGWSSRTFWTYIYYAFRREPMVEELFEHHSSAHELLRQSDLGCHLCTLIWGSMSEDQQTELLEGDIELEMEHSRARSAVREGETLRAAQERVVRIKLQSPYAQRRWTMVWRRRHGWDDVRLIPHFRGQKLARRWLPRKFASCLISFGEDPALNWDEEHVDALGIRATDIKNEGPIILPLSFSTSTDTTMAFIKNWLNEHDHRATKQEPEPHTEDFVGSNYNDEDVLLDFQVTDNTFLPTRLIYVGQDDSEIRLCYSTEIRMSSEYATSHTHNHKHTNAYVALSHCWGTTPSFITLKRSLLSEFRKKISYENLPATFKEAILVTRKLGLRFIWIDSLCIIQDSFEMQDWCQEAPTMKDVYSNAYFVFAATKSWDSSHSTFVQQNPLNMSPCLVAAKGHLAGRIENLPKSFGGVYVIPSNKFTKNAREDLRLSRLRTRGWCFQEEALAKKLVYFGDYQIILHCKDPCDKFDQQVEWRDSTDDGSNLDDYPSLITTRIFSTTVTTIGQYLAPYWKLALSTRILRQSKPRKTIRVPTVKADAPFLPYKDERIEVLLTHEWWAEVSKYSSRFLSKERDKLEALAGIVSKYQHKAGKTLEVQYIAGLWEPYIAMGLLWYVSRNRQGRSKKVYRAPSWSWAAVDGIITNNSLYGGENPETSCITILEAHVNGSISADEPELFPLGAVSSGFLKILGCVRTATWKVPPAEERKFYIGHIPRYDAPEKESDLAHYVSVSNDPDSGPVALPLFADSGAHIGFFIPDAIEDVPTEIHCLKILVQPETRVGKENFDIPWVTRGLALIHDGSTSNQYRRVGYIELNRTHGGISIPGTFSQPWSLTSDLHHEGIIRSPAPNLDVGRFFKDVQASEICIR